MKYILVLVLFGFVHPAKSQSFSSEQTAAVNFIKRVYNASPFEGVKKIEGDEGIYHVVAVSLMNVPRDSILAYVSKAQVEAQELAEQGFAEPCVKFEMVNRMESRNQCTYLFFCITLNQFISDFLKRKTTDGARIVSAPGNKYLAAFITLENAKYSDEVMRDKAAFMKAKQHVNTLINGSTISSEQILRTDESDASTAVTNTEIIKEQAMGFIQGLELLFAAELIPSKTTYVYYSKL
jgi:hypothetical protein